MTDRYAAFDRLKIDRPADRVLRITFNNPETYNSIDAQTHTQITEIWREIDADPEVNVVIVTGEGKAFSSGGDFNCPPPPWGLLSGCGSLCGSLCALTSPLS